MAGLFRTDPFTDAELGEFRRSRGRWRGKISIQGVEVPLVLAGTRAGPDSESLELARTVTSDLFGWERAIEEALFEHHEPYAPDSSEVSESQHLDIRLEDPADAWRHTQPEFVAITLLEGRLTIEIGYHVAWDEEHTLGARIQGGELTELSGSVLSP
ncbi:MAG: hypothetical protein OEU54_12025 [Gemmatimonadota bacterium]|nr:hypothetical protein [Gemmatimonadota bacterium]